MDSAVSEKKTTTEQNNLVDAIFSPHYKNDWKLPFYFQPSSE